MKKKTFCGDEGWGKGAESSSRAAVFLYIIFVRLGIMYVQYHTCTLKVTTINLIPFLFFNVASH